MWPFKKKVCTSWRNHDWELLGVLRSGRMTMGIGADEEVHENGMQQVVCQCSRCPVGTANIWRWNGGMRKQNENPYWYGSALGGEDVKVSEPEGPDGKRKYREPIEYEEPVYH